MAYLKYLHAALTIAALIALAAIFIAYRSEHQQQLQLAAKLNAAQQTITAATASQKSRDQALAKSLSALAKQKSTIQQPTQIIKSLPEILPLPTAISLVDTPPSANQPDSPDPKIGFPSEDLKPLYDFAADCKACQAKLTTAQADLKDEQLKTQTLSRERDDALRVAKGGTVAQRVLRAAKWFALGAAAGALAIKLAH
jgi:hypothetical protein